MPTQLDTFSTPGNATYTLPANAMKVDFVALGGGGGGQGGGAGNNNGRAGGAGTYSPGLTLTRGVDFPWDKTTFPITVGAAGPGGIGGSGSSGTESALNVEYGAVGAGATGSGTGTVALSWTHTPNGYDNYVIVSLSASVTGGSFSTHTRTVTYGGLAMTSLGAANANNSTSGWVESFGIPVTPMAGPKQVSVTVSKAAAVYSSVKANSISYGNVDTTAVIGAARFGSGTTLFPALANSLPGGIIVCSVLGLSSTISGNVAGNTHRSLNNTAPSFLILENADGLVVGLSSVANFAATTPHANVVVTLPSRVLGYGGSANSINWVAPPTGRGGSPGDKVFNGQTYVGGLGSLNTNSGAQPAAATAPGAGGGGSGGFAFGSTANGGSGSAGSLWAYSYGTISSIDSATAVTATRTAALSATKPSSAATTAATGAAAASLTRTRFAGATASATAATTAGTTRRVNAEANLAATAKVSDPWQLQGFQGLFFAYDLAGLPWTPGAVSAGFGVAANTVVTAARSASLSRSTTIGAATTATATFSVSNTKTIFIGASATAVAAFSASGGRGQFLSANLSATGATGTPQPLYTAGAFSSLFVNSLLAATGLRTAIGTANLTSTAARSANITSFGVLNTSIVATAARTGNLVSNQRMSSTITGTATATGFLSRGQTIAAVGVTATGSRSGTVSYGASAGANLISTALFSSSIVKIRLLSGSASATAAFSASLVENTVAQVALIVTAARAAALTKTLNAAASITAIAAPTASMTATRKIQAALSVVAYRDGMIDEPREIVYVAADDRKAAVQIDRNRKADIGKHDRYAGVPANSDRTATVETTEVGQAISRDALEGFRGLFFWFVDLPMIRSSSRSYPIGEDDRSISVDAEDRDALVPATRPESLLK
jgi:hypothetical protein